MGSSRQRNLKAVEPLASDEEYPNLEHENRMSSYKRHTYKDRTLASFYKMARKYKIKIPSESEDVDEMERKLLELNKARIHNNRAKGGEHDVRRNCRLCKERLTDVSSGSCSVRTECAYEGAIAFEKRIDEMQKRFIDRENDGLKRKFDSQCVSGKLSRTNTTAFDQDECTMSEDSRLNSAKPLALCYVPRVNENRRTSPEQSIDGFKKCINKQVYTAFQGRDLLKVRNDIRGKEKGNRRQKQEPKTNTLREESEDSSSRQVRIPEGKTKAMKLEMNKISLPPRTLTKATILSTILSKFGPAAVRNGPHSHGGFFIYNDSLLGSDYEKVCDEYTGYMVISRKEAHGMKHTKSVGRLTALPVAQTTLSNLKQRNPKLFQQPFKPVGFTKHTMDRKTDQKSCNRKPAKICKPLRTICKPISKRLLEIESALKMQKEEVEDETMRVPSSVLSICRQYEGDDLCMTSKRKKHTFCSASRPTSPQRQDPDASKPCSQPHGCTKYQLNSSSAESSMYSPSRFDPDYYPVNSPSHKVHNIEKCSVHCKPNPHKLQPSTHPPWNSDNSYEPIRLPDPKPICLPMPPVIRRPSYNCPFKCDCEEMELDLEDTSCASAISGESVLTTFFEEKITQLSKHLQSVCNEVNKLTAELEEKLEEKKQEETLLCDKEKEVLDKTRVVKKLECEMMNIKSKICTASLLCEREKEEVFCPKVAIQHVHILQLKLEKVRSGAILKSCLLQICNDAKIRLLDYNQQLRENIKEVQEIAKNIKEQINEIKRLF